MEIQSPSPLLQIFEDLGTLNENGLIDIKPFRDWKGFKWKDKIFTMRLCNAGETLDILSYVNKIEENGRGQAIKQEIAIRSIFSIDNRPLITAEELKTYNDNNHTKLSELQYLRTWIRNIEQIILDRIDVVYSGLQLKQIRELQGNCLCERCGGVWERKELIENTRFIKYSLGEIICGQCMEVIEGNEFDFVDKYSDPVTSKETDSIISGKGETMEESKGLKGDEELDYICVCGNKFKVYEEFLEHKVDCPVVNASDGNNIIMNPGIS